MKYLIKFIFISLLFISFSMKNTTGNQTKTKKVYLFAGQSNMDGRADGGQLSEIDLQRLSNVADRISFHYNHQSVTPLQLTNPPEHIKQRFNLNHTFGPELFFGIEMAEQHPNDEFIFIKRSIGGTSLYGCWNPDWTLEKATLMRELEQPKLYSDFMNYIKKVLDDYDKGEYEIMGMLWVQGETDSGVESYGEQPAATYGTNLRNLIESVRTDLSAPHMPFVVFQVGHGKVVTGMKETAKNVKNVFLITQSQDKDSADFYERNPPPIGHYTTVGMKKIGINFSKTFETHYEK